MQFWANDFWPVLAGACKQGFFEVWKMVETLGGSAYFRGGQTAFFTKPRCLHVFSQKNIRKIAKITIYRGFYYYKLKRKISWPAAAVSSKIVFFCERFLFEGLGLFFNNKIFILNYILGPCQEKNFYLNLLKLESGWKKQRRTT